MYVVFNLFEKDETNNSSVNYYSTDLVFDPNGKLILRCRKKYISNVTHFAAGSLNQDCTFQAIFVKRSNYTDNFAVVFDTDLIHYVPDDTIQNVVLTSWSMNIVPFLFGPSLHVGYSVWNKVNLLVSGFAYKEKNFVGSGIYFRNRESQISYQIDTPVVGVVEKGGDIGRATQIKGFSTMLVPQVTFTNISVLTTEATYFSYKKESNVCDLIMDISQNNITPYKWVAFTDRIKYIDNDDHNVLMCGLIKPEQKISERKVVNNVTISVKLPKSEIVQLFPFSLKSDFMPANFTFEEEDVNDLKNATMALIRQEDLLAFGIVVILRDEPSLSASAYIVPTYLLSILLLLSLSWVKFSL